LHQPSFPFAHSSIVSKATFPSRNQQIGKASILLQEAFPSQLITSVLLPTILFLVLSSDDYPEQRRFFFPKIANAFPPREHPKNIVDGYTYNASGCLLACWRASS
jgi:hypothetical protein